MMHVGSSMLATATISLCTCIQLHAYVYKQMHTNATVHVGVKHV